ncbi:MAG: Ig-like domain-containing protein, partial [Methanomicrobiales archaeon]|nr:Ig-like domain-containing protein [Methanomicrobiales archaeon]
MFDVYFGTPGSLSIAQPDYFGTVYDPGILTYDTTYAWKVVAKDPDGATNESEVWTFTTESGVVNHLPVLDPIGDKTVNEGVLLAFPVNATDPDGDALTFSSLDLPAGAVFTPDGHGNYTFSWTPDFTQANTYTPEFEVSDGSLEDTEEVTITVNNVNRAPFALDDFYAMEQGTMLAISAPGLLGNDTDPDDNAITCVKAMDPVHGTVTVNGDGSFSYTPETGYDGIDTFTYQVTDGTDTSTLSTVHLTVLQTLRIEAFSPVHLSVENPDRLKTDWQSSQIPDARYGEPDLDSDGDTDEQVTIPVPVLGEYWITVIPKAGTQVSDTFSLRSVFDDGTLNIATNRAIGDIPTKPFGIRISKEGIELIDTTPPETEITLDGTKGSGGWWTSDVKATLSATDEESGVAATEYNLNSTGWTPYTEPVLVKAEGANNLQYRSEDMAGNHEDVETENILIDKTPPLVTIMDPANGGVYLLRQALTASYTAEDPVSGVASVIGTVPNGGTVPTDAVGSKTLSVVATDVAGNQRTEISSYSIQYQFSGILPPIDTDGSSVFRNNSAVPVKFRLTDAQGKAVTTATVRLFLTRFYRDQPSSEIPAVSPGKANMDSLFRYDRDENLYIFTMDTTRMVDGTWQLRIELDDGSSKIIRIRLR